MVLSDDVLEGARTESVGQWPGGVIDVEQRRWLSLTVAAPPVEVGGEVVGIVHQVLDQLLRDPGAGPDGDPVLLVEVVPGRDRVEVAAERIPWCGSTFTVMICRSGSSSVMMRNTLSRTFHTSRCGVNGRPW